MKSIKIILFCIVLLSACKKSDKEYLKENDNEIIFNEFPSVVEIKGQKLKYTNDVPGYIRSIFIVDSLTIIQGRISDSLMIFNKDDMQYITSFSKLGNGPNEISIPSFASFNADNLILGIMDFGKKKAFFYNIDSIVNFQKYKPEIYDVANPFSNPILNDGFIYYSNIQQGDYSNLLVRQNIKSGKIESVDKHHLINPKDIVKGQEVSGLSGNYIIRNNYLVYSYFFDSKFLIRNLNNNSVVYVHYNDNIRGSGDIIEPKNNPKLAYRRPYLSEDNIYLSYQGTKIYKNENKRNYPKEIHVFNYNGQPIKKILLDREINTFAVDEMNNKLIAVDPNLETLLVEFDLSE